MLTFLFADRRADGTATVTTMHGRVRLDNQGAQRGMANALEYNRTWTPAGDIVETRVVVRDEGTGKYGTLDIPVRKIGK